MGGIATGRILLADTEIEKAPEHEKKKHRLLWTMTWGFLAAGVAVFLFWLLVWRFEESTRDAYVHGNQIVVSPQIAGFVTSLSVEDTEVVKEGRVLVELDTIDTKMALESAKNSLAESVRSVTQMFEDVGTLRGEKEQRKAEMRQAGRDYKHRKNLIESGGVSKEDFQHSETDFIGAFAALLSTQHKLRGAKALVANTTVETHPLVEKAKDVVREAYVNFQRCTIRSPANGMVAKRKVQVGESISPKTPLMTIAPLDQIWVNANFKEVQLKKMRIGQSVTMKADMYGSDVIYHGKVIGISAGTGNIFSVLPPQNATGNWIKIVQRLPVRIELNPEEIKQHPLRLGLSMNVTVDIRDTSGKMIPAPPPKGALFSTDIFNKQEEGVETIIQEIIQKNRTFKESKKSDGRK